MSKDELLAEAVFDEELEKWTAIVEYDGEKIPVGSSEGEFFKICKWDSKEETEEWIKSKFPQMILKSVYEKIDNENELNIDDSKENTTHELKIAPEYFKAVVEGIKTFELRYNDRNFKVGDRLILKEYEQLFDMEYRYTGKEITKEVSYILEGGQYGLAKNFVILAIK